MSDAKQNIPTLTNIVHKGDDNMLNHFDAQQLNDENAISSETSTAVENASEFENRDINEIPSIILNEENETEIPQQDFSEAMQIDVKSSTDTPDKAEIKKIIDQAITDALPGIEIQLKKQLYTKFKL